MADFLPEYQAHRAQGLTHRQISELMGYRPATVARKVARCRAAGLLPEHVRDARRGYIGPMCTCLRCHRERPHRCRGLCRSCYLTENASGRLDNWPRRVNRVEDVVEDFRILWGRGISLEEIAQKLGYKHLRYLASALDRACRRGLMERSTLPKGIFARRRVPSC